MLNTNDIDGWQFFGLPHDYLGTSILMLWLENLDSYFQSAWLTFLFSSLLIYFCHVISSTIGNYGIRVLVVAWSYLLRPLMYTFYVVLPSCSDLYMLGFSAQPFMIGSPLIKIFFFSNFLSAFMMNFLYAWVVYLCFH